MVVEATDFGLPSDVNAYVTVAPLTVGVAVAVKSVVPMALPSSTVTVPMPFGAPVMVISPPQAVIWPPKIALEIVIVHGDI